VVLFTRVRSLVSVFLLLILPFFLFTYLILSIPSFARSGCCSWHGGVCGCRCCDGSALSAKCAPYYPSCNSAPVVQKVYPTATDTPKPIVPTSVPTSVPTKIPTTIPNKTPTPTIIIPIESPIPSNTINPTPTITQSPTNPPQVMGVSDTNPEPKTDSSNGSTAGGILLAGTGYGMYKLFKKTKKNRR